MDLPQHALTGLAWIAWAGAGVATVFMLDLRIAALCIGTALAVNDRLVGRKTVKAIQQQTLEIQRFTREHSETINERVLTIERLLGWGARSNAIANIEAARLQEPDDDLRRSDTGPFQVVKGVG